MKVRPTVLNRLEFLAKRIELKPDFERFSERKTDVAGSVGGQVFCLRCDRIKRCYREMRPPFEITPLCVRLLADIERLLAHCEGWHHPRPRPLLRKSLTD